MEYALQPLTPEEGKELEKKISAYLAGVAPADPGEEEELVLKIEDGQGKLIAGCIAEFYEWNWGRMLLDTLWVDEPYRHRGLASMLIREAERAAREKGCYIACVGTCDFQARGLYEKHGYEVFAVSKDFPRGHEDYSMFKRLDRDASAYVPTHNDGAECFSIKRGSGEDGDTIEEGLAKYDEKNVPESHPYIRLNKKLVDKDGRPIAGVIAGVSSWDGCFLHTLWVEEAYRRKGLGSYLVAETEREAKALNAYICLTYAGDWNAEFFRKQGFTVRGRLEDFPRGHCCFEMEKRL